MIHCSQIRSLFFLMVLSVSFLFGKSAFALSDTQTQDLWTYPNGHTDTSFDSTTTSMMIWGVSLGVVIALLAIGVSDTSSSSSTSTTF